MKFKVTITIQFSIRVKWWSRNLTFHDRFSRIFGKTQFPSSPKKGYFKTRIYRTTSIVHFSSMSKFLVNVNAWFAVPYCDGDWSGRRRKAKGEGGGWGGSRSRRRGNLKLTYVGATLSLAPRTTCGWKQMVSTVPQCHILHPARS